MKKAILGTKIGMTQIFGEGGIVIQAAARSFQEGGHCKQKVSARVQTRGHFGAQRGRRDQGGYIRSRRKG